MGEEKDNIGSMAMLLGTLLAIETSSSSENIDRFEALLSKTIKEHVESRGSMTLSVDYAPDHILGNLARETEISTDVFPWKTYMWIKEDNVSVRCGYGADTITIFPIESAK